LSSRVGQVNGPDLSIKGAHVAPSTGIKPRPTVVGTPASPSARRSSLNLTGDGERAEGVSPWESMFLAQEIFEEPLTIVVRYC
jgi:hypothetical protein